MPTLAQRQRCCITVLLRYRETKYQCDSTSLLANSATNIRGILCLRFRTSLIYINNCPTRCNTKQSVYCSESSLYMFRVSTTPIIRSTQNCNYSLRYWSYFLCSYLPATWPSWPRWREVLPVPEAVITVLCTAEDWVWLKPETCRVNHFN
jgi:hypothetical protein